MEFGLSGRGDILVGWAQHDGQAILWWLAWEGATIAIVNRDAADGAGGRSGMRARVVEAGVTDPVRAAAAS